MGGLVFEERYDVIVIGTGHAGCEAALAAARMGMRVLLLGMNLDAVAMMPCNPSIGGPGKGHLVREIDALGGEMGRAVDATAVQMRLLNVAKGPAVQSLRAQVDRRRYHARMRQVLENQPGLYLVEAVVSNLIVDDSGARGVATRTGRRYGAKVVVLCSGTYLRSRVHVGDVHYAAGPRGQAASDQLAEGLRELGLRIWRFKTGTSPRLHRRSIDFHKMERLEGDALPHGFAFGGGPVQGAGEPCWLTYTNASTHELVRANLHRSAMYSGAITGPGPRYCPSIEAKLVAFPERERHQIFVEPEGRDTQEMYLAGLSMSLPEAVQVACVHTIVGLERAEITRSGYAIEYDCIDSRHLDHGLAVKDVPGLYMAGQINGTTGYEEAAAQGLVAGINAVRHVRGQEPLVLKRSEAYIGVLIDDLVTKGTGEPYRMMTSRAEYRLLLREGSADRRLTPLGYELGLVNEERYRAFLAKRGAIEGEKARLGTVVVQPGALSEGVLALAGGGALRGSASLAELLRRPGVSYAATAVLDPERPELPGEVRREIETDLRYEGYVARQERQVAAQQRMEQRRIPKQVVYEGILGLSREAREKLEKVRPVSIGQAARIPGVTPADIAVLLVYLEHWQRGRR